MTFGKDITSPLFSSAGGGALLSPRALAQALGGGSAGGSRVSPTPPSLPTTPSSSSASSSRSFASPELSQQHQQQQQQQGSAAQEPDVAALPVLHSRGFIMLNVGVKGSPDELGIRGSANFWYHPLWKGNRWDMFTAIDDFYGGGDGACY